MSEADAVCRWHVVSYLSRSKLCLKLRGTINAAAKKRFAVWKRLCWAASHSTQDASPSPGGMKVVTTEIFVSFARLMSVDTSELSDGDEEFQNASVQTVNSVKLSDTGVVVVVDIV
jgi:hypothetical protein